MLTTYAQNLCPKSLDATHQKQVAPSIDLELQKQQNAIQFNQWVYSYLRGFAITIIYRSR